MDRTPPVPQSPRTGRDFDPWASTSADLPDSWADPVDERGMLRRRLFRFRMGYSALGLALLIVSLTSLGGMILFFRGIRQPLSTLLGIANLDLFIQSSNIALSLFGACLLWDRWPDVNWQRRSGLLLMMCIVDTVLLILDQAPILGLSDAKFPHEWYRDSLGTALGWSEFALIASLAADKATFLGESQAMDFGKAVRSLATTGAMVWFMYFYFRTSWRKPWPLHARPMNEPLWMLFLSWHVLATIIVVQVTGLTLLAGRCCGRALREMAEQDRKDDMIPSRSEIAWEELNRTSGPNRGA